MISTKRLYRGYLTFPRNLENDLFVSHISHELRQVKNVLKQSWALSEEGRDLQNLSCNDCLKQCIHFLTWHCTVNPPYFFCPINRSQTEGSSLIPLLLFHSAEHTAHTWYCGVCSRQNRSSCRWSSRKSRGHTSFLSPLVLQREACVEVSQNMCHSRLGA